MTGTWDRFGTWFPLTVIKIENNQVVDVIKSEKENKSYLQIGGGIIDVEKTTKPMQGHFIKNGVSMKKDLKQFEVTNDNILPVGYKLSVRHFVPGQFVDTLGTSKGKGWNGVMKRWNFAGGFASHGNSLKHRGGVNKYK